jgi:hypothetical protein
MAVETAEDARDLLEEARLPGRTARARGAGPHRHDLETATRLLARVEAQAARWPRIRARAAGLADQSSVVTAVRECRRMRRGELRRGERLAALRRLRRDDSRTA